jgi:hypothetical protein
MQWLHVHDVAGCSIKHYATINADMACVYARYKFKCEMLKLKYRLVEVQPFGPRSKSSTSINPGTAPVTVRTACYNQYMITV